MDFVVNAKRYNMKIVNVIGGLGNQMFQYAFALALKTRFKNEDILIDIHHFNHYKLHNGFELTNIFKGVDISIATKIQLKKVTYYVPHYLLSRFVRTFLPKCRTEFIEEIEYVYDSKPLNLEGNYYFEGYWQVYKYYSNIKQQILEAFEFPHPNGYNNKLALEIKKYNSVGIHIRRGDYLNHKDFKGLCELDYYQRAISDLMSISNDYKFYVFSNDIKWCIENIQPLIGEQQVIYITENKGNDSFWDMYLMSKCRNLIIANSSFSWWGAFLNTKAERIYVPTKWVNRNYEVEIYDPTWIKI